MWHEEELELDEEGAGVFQIHITSKTNTRLFPFSVPPLDVIVCLNITYRSHLFFIMNMVSTLSILSNPSICGLILKIFCVHLSVVLNIQTRR